MSLLKMPVNTIRLEPTVTREMVYIITLRTNHPRVIERLEYYFYSNIKLYFFFFITVVIL